MIDGGLVQAQDLEDTQLGYKADQSSKSLPRLQILGYLQGPSFQSLDQLVLSL